MKVDLRLSHVSISEETCQCPVLCVRTCGVRVLYVESWWERRRIVSHEAFIGNFGGKNFCFADVKLVACCLDGEEADLLVEDAESAAIKAKRNGSYAVATAARLRRAFRRPQNERTPEEMVADVNWFVEKWTDGCEEGTLHNVQPAADELLALAVTTLVDLDRSHCQAVAMGGRSSPKDRVFLFDALALIEFGLVAHPLSQTLKARFTISKAKSSVVSAMTLSTPFFMPCLKATWCV